MTRAIAIIPAYNESATIAAVIESIRAHAPGVDIAVVDDGSADATAAIVARAPGVHLLRLPFNLGIGGAMQTGYKFAFRNGYDVAVQCDADGQHPAEEIPRLIEAVAPGRADVAIGSRYVADSDYRPSLLRRIGKSLLSRWIDLLVGGGVTDTTSGFRALNRRALAVVSRHYPEDYPEPEVLVILHRCGLRAVEVPVRMRPRQGGETSIRPHGAAYYMIKVSMASLIDLFRRFAPAREGAP